MRSAVAEEDGPRDGPPAAQGETKQGKAATEKGGKKKRKLASNSSVAVGRCSEEMVTPAKGGEQHGTRAGEDPQKRAKREGKSPKEVATDGDSKPDEELAQGSPPKKSKKAGGVEKTPEEGARKSQEGKGSKKGGKKPQPASQAGEDANGKGVSKKGVPSIEANKENIKSGEEATGKEGAACGRVGGQAVALAAPYFAFGGTGEQKDSMLKKVKVGRNNFQIASLILCSARPCFPALLA